MFVKQGLRKTIKATPGYGLPYTYWALVIVRLALTCMPQNGYIHPDEFFQTMEPVTGDALELDVRRCWEFNITFPVRSMALPFITINIPLKILLVINQIFLQFFNINLIIPYSILIIPRLVFFGLSLVNDYCLFKICKLYGQNCKNRLLTLASSHIMLIYSTRTFTNSLEMTLVSLLIYLVADCMLMSDCIIHHNEYLSEKYHQSKNIVEKVNIYKLKTTLPAHSLSKCFQIGCLTAVGIFNRPTFIGFAFPPIFFWLVRGLGSKYIGFKDFHCRIALFVLSMIPAIVILILIDSFYYSYLTTGEILNLKISMDNFVVTPVNFLKHNLLHENLAQHGLHPRWLHILVNLPILFNVLGVAGIITVLHILYRLCKGCYGSMPKVKSVAGLMIFSFITPVALLSFFPHQEPRFLIPVILPVIFLFTHVLQKTESDSRFMLKVKRHTLLIWCICNILLTIVFGFIHQGGVYHVARHMQNEIRAKPRATVIHLVTSHMYDIPHSLLLLPSTSKIRRNRVTGQKYHLSKQFYLYEYGSKSLDDVVSQLRVIWKVNEMKWKHNFRLYFVLPSSLRSELNNAWFNANMTGLALTEEAKFFPHLSTEAFPYFPKKDDQSCALNERIVGGESYKLDLTFIEKFKCFLSQFSLVLYKVDSITSYLTEFDL